MLGDSPEAHLPIAAPDTLPFDDGDAEGLARPRGFVELSLEELLVPTSVHLRDFDVRQPDLPIEGHAGEPARWSGFDASFEGDDDREHEPASFGPSPKEGPQVIGPEPSERPEPPRDRPRDPVSGPGEGEAFARLWVALELLDSSGAPMAGEPAHVYAHGDQWVRLDADGYFAARGLPLGTDATAAFPDLDGGAKKPLAVEAPPFSPRGGSSSRAQLVPERSLLLNRVHRFQLRRRSATAVEITHDQPQSIVPLPAAIPALHACVVLGAAHSGDTTRVTGHARPDEDVALGALGAEVVHALLTGDRAAYAGRVAKDRYLVSDYQQVLRWLAGRKGWACDPGPVSGEHGPRTSRALHVMKERFSAAYRPITVDDSTDEDFWAGRRSRRADHAPR